jgi:hypothetical protein
MRVKAIVENQETAEHTLKALLHRFMEEDQVACTQVISQQVWALRQVKDFTKLWENS